MLLRGEIKVNLLGIYTYLLMETSYVGLNEINVINDFEKRNRKYSQTIFYLTLVKNYV